MEDRDDPGFRWEGRDVSATIEKTRRKGNIKHLVDVGEFLDISADDEWMVRELARECPEFIYQCQKCSEDKTGKTAIKVIQNKDSTIGGMLVVGTMLLYAKKMGIPVYFSLPSEHSIRRCEIMSFPSDIIFYCVDNKSA